MLVILLGVMGTLRLSCLKVVDPYRLGYLPIVFSVLGLKGVTALLILFTTRFWLLTESILGVYKPRGVKGEIFSYTGKGL
jgi:hypothetical protein